MKADLTLENLEFFVKNWGELFLTLKLITKEQFETYQKELKRIQKQKATKKY